MVLIKQSATLSTIADLAEPEYRLAGLRFNPKLGAQSRTRYFVSLKLQALPKTGATTKPVEKPIAGLPVKLHVISAQWSADGQHIALVNADSSPEPAGLSLWIVDVAKASPRASPACPPQCPPHRSDRVAQQHVARRAHRPRPSRPRSGSLQRSQPVPSCRRTTAKRHPRAHLRRPAQDSLPTRTSSSTTQPHRSREVKLGAGIAKARQARSLRRASTLRPTANIVFAEELHRPFSYHQPYERFPERREVFTIATGEPRSSTTRR
jgi:hypothetical protein